MKAFAPLHFWPKTITTQFDNCFAKNKFWFKANFPFQFLPEDEQVLDSCHLCLAIKTMNECLVMPDPVLLDSPSAVLSSSKCDWKPAVQSAHHCPYKPVAGFSFMQIPHIGVREQGLCSLTTCFFNFETFSQFPYFPPFIFQFGLSLLYALLSHGENLLSSCLPLEPGVGDFEAWWEL